MAAHSSPAEAEPGGGKAGFGRKRLVIRIGIAVLAVAAVASAVWGYRYARELHGADFNFDGYITPKEIADYSAQYAIDVRADEKWQVQPLTMYGSMELKHVADRLYMNDVKMDWYAFMKIYENLEIGGQDILTIRADKCRVTEYNIHRLRDYKVFRGMYGPGNELKVRLDCSAQAEKGKILSAELSIVHNDRCLKGKLSHDDNTGRFTKSSFIDGEFIAFKDKACFNDPEFGKSNLYYNQSTWISLELTRGFENMVRHENFFMLNRHLNAEAEERRRARAKADRAREQAERASCAAGQGPAERCAAIARQDAELKAAAAADDAAAAAAAPM